MKEVKTKNILPLIFDFIEGREISLKVKRNKPTRVYHVTSKSLKTQKYSTRIPKKLIEIPFKYFSLIFVLLVCSCSSKIRYTISDFNHLENFNQKNSFDEKYLPFKMIMDSIKILSNQVAAFKLTSIGEYYNAQKYFDNVDSLASVNLSTTPSNLRIYTEADFIKNILETNKEIFLNEAHHRSDHRLFLLKIIQNIKYPNKVCVGFEAFNSNDSLFSFTGIPTSASGYYISDPIFAECLRSCFEKKYNVFGYEANSKTSFPKEREIQQAENIYNYRIKNGCDNLLVYGGFDHMREDTFLSKNWGGRAMISYYKNLSKTNPLSIDQYQFSHKSSSNINQYYFNLVKEETNILEFNDKLLATKKIFDYLVVSKKLNNNDEKRKLSNVDEIFCLEKKYYHFAIDGLILAYNEAEFRKNNSQLNSLIPYDIVSLKNIGNCKLRLKKRQKYILEVRDRNNVKIKFYKIGIDD